MKILIRREMHLGGYAIWLYDERRDQIFFAKPTEIVFEDTGHTGAALLPDPTFVLRTDQLQTLQQSIISELERAGLRSPDLASQAKLDATERHLEDMRRLVFDK